MYLNDLILMICDQDKVVTGRCAGLAAGRTGINFMGLLPSSVTKRALKAPSCGVLPFSHGALGIQGQKTVPCIGAYDGNAPVQF